MIKLNNNDNNDLNIKELWQKQPLSLPKREKIE